MGRIGHYLSLIENLWSTYGDLAMESIISFKFKTTIFGGILVNNRVKRVSQKKRRLAGTFTQYVVSGPPKNAGITKGDGSTLAVRAPIYFGNSSRPVRLISRFW